MKFYEFGWVYFLYAPTTISIKFSRNRYLRATCCRRCGVTAFTASI